MGMQRWSDETLPLKGLKSCRGENPLSPAGQGLGSLCGTTGRAITSGSRGWMIFSDNITEDWCVSRKLNYKETLYINRWEKGDHLTQRMRMSDTWKWENVGYFEKEVVTLQ